MSTIKFNKLQSSRASRAPGGYILYNDIDLDFQIQSNSRDLKPSFDEQAVKNSVINILNTRPGENFLYPDFGLNISKYLFTQISEFNGQVLGDNIVASITKYEPRVKVLSVDVAVNIDEQQYTVTLVLYIPTIGKRITFSPVFTDDGSLYIRD